MRTPLHARLARALDKGSCSRADVASRCRVSADAVRRWAVEERDPQNELTRNALSAYLDELEAAKK